MVVIKNNNIFIKKIDFQYYSMNPVFHLGKDHLTSSTAIQISKGLIKINLDQDSILKIQKSAAIVDNIAAGKQPVYGINTGFGPLCNTKVSSDETSQLQKNLLLSHSVGVGDNIDSEVAKLMLILKVHVLSKGFSGVSLEIVERIIWHIENDIIPSVPSQGSVGASGDLAPLSHLFLPLLGEGELLFNGTYQASNIVLERFGLSAIQLGPKDGLALINGTQFISAHAVILLDNFYSILSHADLSSAIMIDALQGSLMPFHEDLHKLRPYSSNVHVAGRISSFLKDSEIMENHKDCDKVQDPYSLRCIPQVHGASRNAWLHLKENLEIEINSVTDNPIVYSEEHTISGGNFHGQPLALPIDYACLAISEMGNIADRRMYLSLEGKSNGVPKLLMDNTGINSGFMILQYTAAALASENKSLCFPASADSISTSLGQEDHVSMGSIGVRKALRVTENTEKIIAIEMMMAAQAIEFRKPLKSGTIVDKIIHQIRQEIPFATEDRLFANDINKSIELLKSKKLLDIEKEFKDDKYSKYDKLFEVY